MHLSIHHGSNSSRYIHNTAVTLPVCRASSQDHSMHFYQWPLHLLTFFLALSDALSIGRKWHNLFRSYLIGCHPPAAPRALWWAQAAQQALLLVCLGNLAGGFWSAVLFGAVTTVPMPNPYPPQRVYGFQWVGELTQWQAQLKFHK